MVIWKKHHICMLRIWFFKYQWLRVCMRTAVWASPHCDTFCAIDDFLRCNCLQHGSGTKQRRITPLLHRKCGSVARRLGEGCGVMCSLMLCRWCVRIDKTWLRCEKWRQCVVKRWKLHDCLASIHLRKHICKVLFSLYPVGQTHMKLPGVFTHRWPVMHGALRHSSVSASTLTRQGTDPKSM